MIGVIIGKFYPPHKGHKFLIESALRQVDDLTVIVCDHPSQEIFAETRANWLKVIHPSVRVVVTPDDLPDEPKPWAKRTIEILGRSPDIVITSESYGEEYAKAMDCMHVLVDIDRNTVPISATQIRSAPLECLDHLEPCVRAHYVKRVVLIGVESTGKSTLAKDLALSLNTDQVEEFGREYCLTKTGEWRTQDFVEIARTQQTREDEVAGKANKVLICDTNAFATSVWHRRYMGFYDEEVNRIASEDKVDLYLLTLPDFPFVQDGTRDGEHIRHDMHQWFCDRLRDQSAPSVILEGSHSGRMEKALAAIHDYFGLTSTVIT
ncbi:MAG: AAA family ATPase [Armatimonadota bacterium]